MFFFLDFNHSGTTGWQEKLRKPEEFWDFLLRLHLAFSFSIGLNLIIQLDCCYCSWFHLSASLLQFAVKPGRPRITSHWLHWMDFSVLRRTLKFHLNLFDVCGCNSAVKTCHRRIRSQSVNFNLEPFVSSGNNTCWNFKSLKSELEYNSSDILNLNFMGDTIGAIYFPVFVKLFTLQDK